jgi:hypothetical protein
MRETVSILLVDCLHIDEYEHKIARPGSSPGRRPERARTTDPGAVG